MRAAWAIAAKEFRGAFASPMAYTYLVVFTAFAGWFFFRAFFVLNLATMRGFFGLTPWTLVFLVPALTMRLWSEERKLGTLEVLLTWPVRERDAVLGKFLGGLGLLAASLAGTLPIALTVFSLGSPDRGPVLAGYLGLLLFGAAGLAVGIYASALTENQIVAYIAGVAMIFALFVAGEDFVLVAAPGFLAPLLSGVGLGRHYWSIGRGVVDSRDLLYFAAVIFFFLYLTVRRLQAGLGRPTASLPRHLVRLNRIAQTAIIAGILIAANVVAQRWFARWDLTERREYSLSPATRKLLGSLDDRVVINAYFSRRLPPYLTNVRRQVQDVLEEYRAFSRGRLEIDFTDPGDDALAEQRLRSVGIPKVQLEVLERDQYQLTSVYLGLVLLHGGRQEVIPVIQEPGNLEYELTSALLRLTSPVKKTVGWLDASPGGPRAAGADPLRRELARLYELREIRASGLTAVPDAVATLVVAGPRELDEQARHALDQFVMRGGRAVFLVDHFEIPEGSLAALPLESGVLDLLEGYGAKVSRDVVGEPRLNAPAAFSSGFVQFRIAYPWWVRVPGKSLDREHPVTSRLDSIVLPWASSLEPVVPAGGGVTATVLARSSQEAYTVTETYDFSPQPRREIDSSRTAAPERPLIVLLSGRFPSFWRGKTPPVGARAGAPAATESVETSLLVVGTSRLAEPEFLRQFPENLAFLLNTVDWMTLGPDLIGIRSRIADERPLPAIPEQAKHLIKIVNVVGVPLLIALLGALRLNARRRSGTES